MAEGDGQEVTWLKAVVEQLLAWHDAILSASGGLPGVHMDRLHAACARPFQTFDGSELYGDPWQKAAALFHALVKDHPFVDGNKRTATFASVVLLIALGSTRDVPRPLQVRLLGEIAIEIAQGGLTVDQVADWLRRILEASLR